MAKIKGQDYLNSDDFNVSFNLVGDDGSRGIRTLSAPLSYGLLTKEQFDVEIKKGMADIKDGKVKSVEEVEAELKRDYEL